MTPPGRLNHVFSHSQSATRTIAARLIVFVLTAGLGQVFSNLLRHPHKHSLRLPGAARVYNDPVAFSPVQVVSFPSVDFPKPLKKFDALNFWITSSLVVSESGEIKDIRVPADLAETVQDESFAKDVLSKVSSKERDLVQAQMIEILRTQLQQTKFRPRISEGTPFATQVYMSSNFQWDGKLCWKVETVFMTSSGSIWDRIDANHNLDPCVGY